VAEITIFECKDSLLKRNLLVIASCISFSTGKPIPPKMISEVITKLTLKLSIKRIRLLEYKLNPALQKAEIE